jgi:S1-C subfamily serine protease
MDLALIAVEAGFIPEVGAEDAAAVAGTAVTAVGIDAGEGGAGERLALSGVVLDPSEELAAFGPGLVAWVPGARPGFSGGPLLDDEGRLVGMVTAIRPAEGRGPVATAGGRGRPAVEAFALRAGEVRNEVRCGGSLPQGAEGGFTRAGFACQMGARCAPCRSRTSRSPACPRG